jgi:hypothetical protein
MRIGYNDSMKKSFCPKCRSVKVLRIAYGYFDPVYVISGQEEKEDNTIFYGGCEIMLGESPAWHCDACNHEWGIYKN